MALHEFLQDHAPDILAAAAEAMHGARAKHYEQAGEEHVHQRLKALFTLTVRGIKDRNLGPMLAHAEQIAQERFAAGYDLWEVQTAFNVLEEAIWQSIPTGLPPGEYAQALGLVGTILGAGKDALARRYVSLATRTHAPSMDLRSLFHGTDAPPEFTL